MTSSSNDQRLLEIIEIALKEGLSQNWVMRQCRAEGITSSSGAKIYQASISDFAFKHKIKWPQAMRKRVKDGC